MKSNQEEKTIVIASNNQHKLKEFKEMLQGYNIKTLNDIEFYDEIEETGESFFENALIKAETIHKYLKEKQLEYIVIADDSGLCVDSLGGAPGVYSARYCGEHGDDKANRDKLQKELEGKSDRSAKFVCNIVVYYPNGKYQSFIGETLGTITTEELGKTDFGYDCIFFSNDLNKTFGEASDEEKNSISHRGRALEKVVSYLEITTDHTV